MEVFKSVNMHKLSRSRCGGVEVRAARRHRRRGARPQRDRQAVRRPDGGRHLGARARRTAWSARSTSTRSPTTRSAWRSTARRSCVAQTAFTPVITLELLATGKLRRLQGQPRERRARPEAFSADDFVASCRPTSSPAALLEMDSEYKRARGPQGPHGAARQVRITAQRPGWRPAGSREAAGPLVRRPAGRPGRSARPAAFLRPGAQQYTRPGPADRSRDCTASVVAGGRPQNTSLPAPGPDRPSRRRRPGAVRGTERGASMTCSVTTSRHRRTGGGRLRLLALAVCALLAAGLVWGLGAALAADPSASPGAGKVTLRRRLDASTPTTSTRSSGTRRRRTRSGGSTTTSSPATTPISSPRRSWRPAGRPRPTARSGRSTCARASSGRTA